MQFGEPAANCAADIVQHQACNPRLAVKNFLQPLSSRIGPLAAHRKDEGAELRQTLEDISDCRSQRQRVIALPLVALLRQGPNPLLRVDLAPEHAPDLVSALAGEDQRLDEGAARVTQPIRRLPDGAEFIMAEHPLTARLDFALADRRGGIRLNPLTLNCPIERGNDLRADPINLRAKALLILEVVEHLDDIGTAQFVKPPATDYWLDVALEHSLGQFPAELVGLAVLGNIAVEHL